jgi:hypothetical protein
MEIHSFLTNLETSKKKSEFTISPVTTIFHQKQEKTISCFFSKKMGSGASPAIPAIPFSVAEGLHADPFPKTGDGIQRRQGRSFTFAHFAHLARS